MSENPPPSPGVPHSGAQRRANRSRANYPRKRALLACQICRKRKTKCDNQRPTCGACQELDIVCTFQDSKSDHSRYDLASLEILERINYVADLLETQNAQHGNDVASPAGLSPQQSQAARSQFLPSDRSVSYSDDHISSLHSTQADPDGLLDSLEFTGSNPGVSEDILNWPIFGKEYDRWRTESHIFNSGPASHVAEHLGPRAPALPFAGGDPVRTTKPGRGIREDDVLPLINKFLVNVHIKNPILDPDELKAKGRWVAEHGFVWDNTSCLVLLACALASVSSSFQSSEPVTPDLVDGPDPINSLDDLDEYTTAESYYVAAQKRIGLLENTIEATQCYFLLGVYEMYSLRPARAWTSFNRACITLQICFRGQEREEYLYSKEIVSKLYWSCLKSECELRMEIRLPPSGLANVALPDVFPTPPNAVGASGHAVEDSQLGTPTRPESASGRQAEPELAQIWNYYLSELAVRRIGNRIMNSFYKDTESSWLTVPLHRMIRVAEELELQITQWYVLAYSRSPSAEKKSNNIGFEHLPSTLTTPAEESDAGESPPKEELKFVLHARLIDFRERIYRPFLYLAIHNPPDDPVQAKIAPYVQKCVEACVAWIQRGTPRHRHHGTWYENRGMFLKSLLLVAAIKSGNVHVPEVWRHGVGLCIAGFKFWELESPDLREARIVLQELLEELHLGF